MKATNFSFYQYLRRTSQTRRGVEGKLTCTVDLVFLCCFYATVFFSYGRKTHGTTVHYCLGYVGQVRWFRRCNALYYCIMDFLSKVPVLLQNSPVHCLLSSSWNSWCHSIASTRADAKKSLVSSFLANFAFFKRAFVVCVAGHQT